MHQRIEALEGRKSTCPAGYSHTTGARSLDAPQHVPRVLELQPFLDMGMDQYLLIPFWCSPGVQGFDTLPYQKMAEKDTLREKHDSLLWRAWNFRNFLSQCLWRTPYMKHVHWHQRPTRASPGDQLEYLYIYIYIYTVNGYDIVWHTQVNQLIHKIWVSLGNGPQPQEVLFDMQKDMPINQKI